MKNRSYIFLIASTIVVAAAMTGAADPRWNRIAPEGAGFSVEVPGQREPNDAPRQYSYSSGVWLYRVNMIEVDPAARILLERGDKKALRTRLESTRNTMVATANATSERASYGEIDGYPSLRFSITTDELAGTDLLVLTPDYLYMVMTIAPKGVRDDDAKRFLDSFRLTDAAARATASSPAAGDRR